jgi:hypothetical protein
MACYGSKQKTLLHIQMKFCSETLNEAKTLMNISKPLKSYPGAESIDCLTDILLNIII